MWAVLCLELSEVITLDTDDCDDNDNELTAKPRSQRA